MNKQLYRFALLLPAFFIAASATLEGNVLPFPSLKGKSEQDTPVEIYSAEQSSFLKLDNRTYANIHDLLDDPLLILRAQFPAVEEEARIMAAWEYAAKLNALEDYPDRIGHALNPVDLQAIYIKPESDNVPVTTGIVINQNPIFDHVKPVFSIDTGELLPESILWKIVEKKESGSYETVVQAIASYKPHIELTELQSTYLRNDGNYQFQFRFGMGESWSEWSTPYDFRIFKTEGVSKIDFNKVSKGKYEISWKGSDDPQTRYLVFASNSLDFIPSVYFDKLVKALANGTASKCVDCQNLVTETQDEKITIDGAYAYYRIIAETRNCLSIPSEIIYVYDNDLHQSRDVLRFDESSHTAYRCSMDLKGLSSDANANAKNLVKSEYLPEADWERAKPYLIPENHPMKKRLDRLFKKRVTKNATTMRGAGFIRPEPRGLHRPVVSQHRALPGYLVKLFLDNQHGMNDVHRLTRRASGAESIAEAIKRLGYDSIFRVPKKWIYPLPDKPSPHTNYERKFFVLLVQDMNILVSANNKKKWKSSQVSHFTLDVLFSLVEDQGLADSLFAFNVPFDHEGYIAIIDTEVHHHWPVPYDKFLKWLSPANQSYWKSLIKNKPRKKGLGG